MVNSDEATLMGVTCIPFFKGGKKKNGKESIVWYIEVEDNAYFEKKMVNTTFVYLDTKKERLRRWDRFRESPSGL